jgi:hypothetical protein
MTVINKNKDDNESKKFHNPRTGEAWVETRVRKNAPAQTLLELTEIDLLGLSTDNMIVLSTGEVVTSIEGDLLYTPEVG